VGFRIRKSFKLLPGVRINTSLSGVSVSVGRRGATTNISARGVRSTLSIPGTGLAYSSFRTFGETTRQKRAAATVTSQPHFDKAKLEKAEAEYRAALERMERERAPGPPPLPGKAPRAPRPGSVPAYSASPSRFTDARVAVALLVLLGTCTTCIILVPEEHQPAFKGLPPSSLRTTPKPLSAPVPQKKEKHHAK
jgi:hypothetical protein